MRWLFRIFFGLLALGLFAVAALFLLPADRIAKLATDQFQAATGRVMTLEGDVRPTLWPELGVNTGRVTVANADWSGNGPMLRAETLRIGVNMAALFSREIRITRLEAEAPEILLEVASDGRANWDLAGSAPAASAPTAGSGSNGGRAQFLSLDEAVIDGGSITFIDHASGGRTELKGLDATLSLPDLNGPADLRLSALMNGQRLSLTTRIADFAALLSEAAVGVTAKAAVGGSTVDFDGRAGLNPFALAGRIDADMDDRAALFGLAGMAAPDVPPGFGRSMAVSGNVTLTDKGAVTLRGGTIRLDQNVMTGAVDATFGNRPKITADLSAGALDFAALASGDEAGSGGDGATAAGWSRERIDVSALQAVDATIKLSADSIDLGMAQLGRTRTLTTLDAGRAVTDIRELGAYGGQVAGSVVVNSRGGLSTRIKLTGDGVALQPLLQQMADYDRLLANGVVSVNLLGVGNDMHTLMNSLSGDGSVRLGQGELRGFDLVGMLRNLDTSYVGDGQKTIFESIAAAFTVENGVLRNDDMRLTAPLLGASGKGKVGIGAQTLDYRLTAALLEGQTNGGLKIPVMITGTWADPKFRLDLEALAKQELADDVEELKVRAEEVVKNKLKEELGVEVETLDNIEDVLKQELEDRARKGLLDLLSGKN